MISVASILLSLERRACHLDSLMIQHSCPWLNTAVIFITMRMFKVSLVARYTKDESLIAPPVDILVDAGSEVMWLPRDLLAGIKLAPLRKRRIFHRHETTG